MTRSNDNPSAWPRSVIQDNPVLHLTATTSGVVATTDGSEHDDNLYMPEDFFEGIKGARYSHYGQYISGYADSFEELLTVLDRHAQVGGRGRGYPGAGGGEDTQGRGGGGDTQGWEGK